MIYCDDELHQYFTEEELEQTAKELIVMENKPENIKVIVMYKTYLRP